MKKKTSEKLIDHISNLDEDILRTAYETDSEEALSALKEQKHTRTRRSFTLRKLSIILAAAVLALALCIALPLAIANNGERGQEIVTTNNKGDAGDTSPPKLPPITSSGRLDSLDKLNYYGGLLSVIRSSGGASGSLRVTCAPTLLSAIGEYGYGEGEGEWPSPDQDQQEIYYYPLEEMGTFEVYNAIYFEIILDSSCTVLCEALGSEGGEVGVVITQNSIDDMITFRQGDNYYSCLANGGGAILEEYFENKKDSYTGGWIAFSTHKYIDGEQIVKNFSRENYSFYIAYKGKGPTASSPTPSLEDITYFGFNSDTSQGRAELAVVSGSFTLSSVSYLFEISEIEEYFINEDGETLTPKPPSPPEIYDDARLVYYLVDGEYYEIEGFYSPYNSVLVIPEELFGYPVRGIRSHAFCNFKYLTQVTIPDSIEYIGDYAFAGCISLEPPVLPESVRLGKGVFDEVSP